MCFKRFSFVPAEQRGKMNERLPAIYFQSSEKNSFCSCALIHTHQEEKVLTLLRF